MQCSKQRFVDCSSRNTRVTHKGNMPNSKQTYTCSSCRRHRTTRSYCSRSFAAALCMLCAPTVVPRLCVPSDCPLSAASYLSSLMFLFCTSPSSTANRALLALARLCSAIALTQSLGGQRCRPIQQWQHATTCPCLQDCGTLHLSQQKESIIQLAQGMTMSALLTAHSQGTPNTKDIRVTLSC